MLMESILDQSTENMSNDNRFNNRIKVSIRMHFIVVQETCEKTWNLFLQTPYKSSSSLYYRLYLKMYKLARQTALKWSGKCKVLCNFSHDMLIISFKVTFREKLLRPNTTMLQATGASFLFHSVAPPHRPVLMYFSSQQLGRELPADTSPLVQQHIAYTHYCL